MKFATIFLAFMACSRAMHLPNTGNKDSWKTRAGSDFIFSGTGDTDDKVSLAADHSQLSVPITRREVVRLHHIVVLKKGQEGSAYKAYNEWIVKQFSELKTTGNLQDGDSDQLTFFNVLNFMGYTGYLPPALLEDVKKHPMVHFVEEDQICYIGKFAKQKGAPWGVARISQRANARSFDYDYDNLAGKDVTAYVLDTGIKVQHPDFEGRARWGPAIPLPHVQIDGNGHGTHVAGILGGKTYGVAKKVYLVAVQVFDATGKGPTSDIIKGIEYAVNDHAAQVKAKPKGYRGAIMNLSLGAPPSTALDQAVNAAMDGGLHAVVAAGNDNEDACNFSPSRATGPITVGATDINDMKWNDSNWGSCVDVQAPGTGIISTGIHLITAVMSGTSQACPHVAGILATFMSLQPNVGSEFAKDPLVKPVDLKRMFLRFSTRGVVKGLDKVSPNKLAYNGAGLSLKDLWIL